MNKKMMLLALSAISAAMLVAPAASSAGGFAVHPTGQAFTITGGAGYRSTVAGDTINCSSTTGSGAYNAAGTGGTINLLFHGCNAFGFSCNSTNPAQTGGTIATTPNIPFTNVWLDHAKTKPGITLGGTNLVWAHVSCPFTTITWTGSVVGEATNLTCNAATQNTVNLNVTGTPHGVQNQKVTGTTSDTFLITKNGASTHAAWHTQPTIHFANAVGVKC